MNKEVIYGDDARQRVKKGIDLVADTVKVTLGPKGRNVTIDHSPFANPLNTNDGVSIARELTFKDKYLNLGAKAVKEVAAKTNDIAGDGTTTASLLFQTIITEGMKALSNGQDAVSIRRGVDKAAEVLCRAIEKEAVKATDQESLRSIATISCGDEEIGKVIADTIYKLGTDGLVTLEDSADAVIGSEITEGLRLRGGFQIQQFVTHPARQEAILEDALTGVPVFVTNLSLNHGPEVIKFMEVLAQAGFKQGVLIANAIEGEALATALINSKQGRFQLLPIKVVAYGETGEGVLQDVASATGARYFAREEGAKLADITIEDFGRTRKVVASRDQCTIIGGEGDVAARVKELHAQIEQKSGFQKEALQERVARLESAVGLIKVGGTTDTEREERKMRVEDAINATKAAFKAGVVPGGGSALFRASRYNETRSPFGDEGTGYLAVQKACQAPLRQMIKNSSLELDRADLDKVAKNKKLTIDFNTGAVVNAQDSGILDPVQVVISALRNAASGAGLFLITEAFVVPVDDPKTEII